MAVTRGADEPDYSTYANYGPQLLSSGKITMAQLNDAVRHVLTLKYLAGMFSDPYPGQHDACAERGADAGEPGRGADLGGRVDGAAREPQHALPLSTSTPSIAVVGPLADDPLDQLGPDVPIGYDTTPATSAADKIVSVLDGIKAAVPSATVTYAQGCDIDTRLHVDHRVRRRGQPPRSPRP